MSSGSILLQQLRRRRSSKSEKSDGKNENANIITSSSRDGPANPSAISQPAMFASSKKKRQIIEVCLGPDCAVAGGGAALLEIEDLVRQQLQCPNKQTNDNNDDDDTKFIVQAGGCRDHCTEGPNVRILSSNGGRGVDCDFHKVNCPEACRRVVGSLCPKKDTTVKKVFHEDKPTNVTANANDNEHDDSITSSSSSDDVVARLLLRKEDAKRWKAHRERAAKERRLQAIARNEGS